MIHWQAVVVGLVLFGGSMFAVMRFDIVHPNWRTLGFPGLMARRGQFSITREDFIAATGREPINDDLERCNCEKAGTHMHEFCGWDHEQNRPQFEVGYRRTDRPQP